MVQPTPKTGFSPLSVSRVILLAVSLAACGGSQGGCTPPLERLEPTAAATLGPGNETGQDEDPNLLVTRRPDALYAAWYSNRLGVHPDGLARREIFVTRSLDGETWSEPVAATDSHAWSFYPSQARSPTGVFHLAWMRWHLLPDGCIYFDAQHCPGDPGCCAGTDIRIMHAASYDGLSFSETTALEIAHGPSDELPSLVAASDGRLLVYFASGFRAGDTQRQIHVVVHDGTSWQPAIPMKGLDSAESDTFPHVVERAPGAFLLAFTRYDVKSGPSPAKTDVFPYLHPDARGDGWSVLWMNEDGVTSVPVDGAFPGDATSLDLPGYTPRLVRTPTPGIDWGAWVEGVDPTQKVKHRFLAR